MSDRKPNKLGRANERKLENWIEATRGEIEKHNMTQAEVAALAKQALGLEVVTESNVRGAAKIIGVKICIKRREPGKKRSGRAAMMYRRSVTRELCRVVTSIADQLGVKYDALLKEFMENGGEVKVDAPSATSTQEQLRSHGLGLNGSHHPLRRVPELVALKR